MSRALRTVATVAGVVALAATGIGALGSAGILSLSAATASTVSTVATVAAAVSAGTGVLAQLTAKKPPAQGSATQTMIGADQPTPCIIGRSYYGGNRMHDVGYGGEVDDVQNPYRALVDVYSIGPIAGIDALQTDFSTVAFDGSGNAFGWFHDFLYRDYQLGACPEPSALSGPWGSIPQWGATHKLSGLAAVLWSAKFDGKAKRFASGLPALGGVFKGVLCYDPRKDDTYPGGVGPHRIDDQSTWEWTQCPGLHGLKYVLGTWQNGKRVFGIGLDQSQFLIEDFVELANVCDARGWKVNGVVFEPGNRWENLKNILAAGGAEPCFKNARLGVRVNAPKVAVDTITRDDLADGEITVAGMLPWAERKNTIIPKYRSEAHKWEYVAADKVQVSNYLTEDGEEKANTRQFNLVDDVDQAAQLAALELINSREKGPIQFTGKSRLRRYPAGVKLIVDLPEAELDAWPCILTQRTPDPGNMTVPMTLMGETDAKYPIIEAVTGVAPPPIVLPTPEEIDGATGSFSDLSTVIANSFPIGLTITAADDGSITISDHTRRYTDGHADVAVTGATIPSGGAAGDFFAIGYDDQNREGGAVTYQLFTDDLDARVSPAHPYRHYVGYVTIPTAGSPPSGGGGATPPGGACVTTDTPVMMADGTSKAAGDLAVGDWLRTRDELTLEWGRYPITAIAIVPDEPVWKATIGGRVLRATGEHKVYIETAGGGAWTAMADVPGAAEDGIADVVKMTVARAATYVSNGILSHNIKMIDDGNV